MKKKNSIIQQFENNPDLLTAIDDFLDNLNSLGIEALVDLDSEGLVITYQKPAEIPSIKNEHRKQFKTPVTEDIQDFEKLLKNDSTSATQNNDALHDDSQR